MYRVLYRKWRPQTFEEVYGQPHITATLKNELVSGRVAHAYLFTGSRGTGKTTCAKILSKAVNCLSPHDGDPCNECEICRGIDNGSVLDVIEIDAASNNGVDNIRDLRDEANFTPVKAKYRVYIIDEVHMLSIGAFNALLKTLEEPPSYVIFILATTEAHKIPITILSRCQRYDFRRISIETISDRLMELMEKENVEVEERAIRYIAKAADGSMRDALSLLDQCIAFYLGQKLTYDHVLEVLGAVDTEVFSKLLRKVLAEDVAGAISQLEELVIEGRDLGQFVNDFTWYLRNLLLLKGSDDMEEVLDMSSENMALLKEEARLVEADVLMRYIRIFSELSNQVKYSSQKRILIEIAIIKLCKPAMETNMDSITDRLAKLEKKMEQGIPMAAPVNTATQPAEAAAPVSRPPMPKAIPEDVEQIVKNWNSILPKMSGVVRTYLKSAHLSLGGDDRLMIVLDDPVAAGYVEEEDHRNEIRQVISDYIEKEVEIQIQQNQSNRPFEESYVDLSQIINMDITIEDE